MTTAVEAIPDDVMDLARKFSSELAEHACGHFADIAKGREDCKEADLRDCNTAYYKGYWKGRDNAASAIRLETCGIAQSLGFWTDDVPAIIARAILSDRARNAPDGVGVEPVAWAAKSMFNHYGMAAVQDRRDATAGFTEPLYAAPPTPTASPTHRHKKRGGEYALIGYGRMQAKDWFDAYPTDDADSIDMREVAIYRSVDDGSLWARPREEFEDGRFEVLASAPSASPAEPDWKRGVLVKDVPESEKPYHGPMKPKTTTASPASGGEVAHPDDEAVDRFAAAMKAKLAQKRTEGRGGWDDPAQCSSEHLSRLLREHVEKGDPLDVGNLAMMLHQRGEAIIQGVSLRRAYDVGKRQGERAALIPSPEQGEVVREPDAELVRGIELAAKYVEQRRDDYIAKHGYYYDHTTGVTEIPSDCDEYVGALWEIAEGIRTLSQHGGANHDKAVLAARPIEAEPAWAAGAKAIAQEKCASVLAPKNEAGGVGLIAELQHAAYTEPEPTRSSLHLKAAAAIAERNERIERERSERNEYRKRSAHFSALYLNEQDRAERMKKVLRDIATLNKSRDQLQAMARAALQQEGESDA